MAISADYRPAILTQTPVRIELDSWSAGGDDTGDVVDAQGTQWIINTLDGWQGGPGVRTSLTERPGEHGSFDGAAFLQPRVITIEGIAYCEDRAAAFRARDIISSVCGDTASLMTLTVYEDPAQPVKQAAVRRSAETKTGPVRDDCFAWSMILVAPDPRRYATDQSTSSIGLPQVGSGGLVFPLVFPLTFGSGTGGGEMTLTNTGTIAVWPQWTIQGPVTGPSITNLDTGETLTFDPAFSAAGTVDIDSDAKTVFESTTSRRADLFTAEWFQLPPGDTNIRFADSGGSASALLTATWRDGWV